MLIYSNNAFGQCTTTTTFTTTSASNWTVPAGTTSITIEAWGGGGAGGGSNNAGNGNARGGAGGGGGAYSIVTLTGGSFSIGDIFNIAVGSGGTGVNGSNGNPGNPTSVIRGATTFILAPRGLGGQANTGTAPTGGAGGNTGGVGTITPGTNGSNGSTGLQNVIVSGAGGNGGNGGTGGASIGISLSSNGNLGNIIGGGGGGSRTNENGGNNLAGGAGARGEVRITFTIAQNTSTSAAPNRTVCINTALPAITHTTTGATGIGAATGLPTGVTASWASNTITISGTPSVSGTFDYSIPMTGGCTTGQVAVTGTVTVTPNQTVGAGTSSSLFCINAPLGTNITHSTTNATGIANNGVSGANGLPAGMNATWAGNVITISGTPTASGTFNYSIAVQGCLVSGVNATGTITVTPNNTFGTITSNTFCANSAIPAGVTQSTTGATGIGTPTGLPAGVTAAWAANQITFSGTPSTSGSYSYSIPLTGGCGTVNAIGTITVNEVPAISSQTTPGGAICISSGSFAQMSVGTGFGYTYQWFSNDTPDYITPTLITSETNNFYTPRNDTAGTLYYYVVVGSSSCASVPSPVSGAYIVNPNNTVGPPSSSPVICEDVLMTTPITFTTTGATGIGAISWLPSNPGGMGASFSANTITITGTPANPGVYTYSIPLTGGCGTVNATGTITVAAAAAIITPSLAGQPAKCVNTGTFGAISVGTGQGLTYQWYSNDTPDYTSPSLITGAITNNYAPPTTTVGTTYYYVIVSSPTCGTTATSAPSGAFIVNPLPVVTFTAQPSGTPCVDTNLTYTTQSGQSNYVWTIPGQVAGTDYTIVSGGNSTSNTAVIRWLTDGSKSISVNYTDPNGCGTPTAATSNSTIQKNTVDPPSTPNPVACINGTFSSITLATKGATGIDTLGSGLPNGLIAIWTPGSGGNGTIEISGAVNSSVTPGPKPYSIRLTGGCGTVVATGVIDIQPVYTINTISSVSPSTTGGSATITLTVSPATLTNGSYVVNYQMGLANPRVASNVTVNFTNGVGTFFTSAITNEDLTSLTVNSIRKGTDPISCPVATSTNNVTFFGIQPKIYPSNGTFYVPAGIFQITVKVYGGGGGGGGGGGSSNKAGGGGGGYSEQTINVVPGEAIGIFIGAGGAGQIDSGTPAGNGGPSWVTRDSSDPNPQTSSLAYAFGGGGANVLTQGAIGVGQTANGAIGGNPNVIPDTGGTGGKGGGVDGGNGGPGGAGTGNRPGITGSLFGGGGGGSKGNSIGGGGARGYVIITYPLPPISSCFKVIDDGAITGTTIIEYTCENQSWTAPEGLLAFTTYVGGGGGGGGSGSGAGGGGAGGYASGPVDSGSPIGFPANTTFSINAGVGGTGAPNINIKGTDGNPSNITGVVNGSTVSYSVGGGGGGGSQTARTPGNGTNGSSGGGGGSSTSFFSNGGPGSNPGRAGGNGSIGAGSAFAGGGGGGVASIGETGKAAGGGQGEGGNGGAGIQIFLGGSALDTVRYFGGGGGGIGNLFNGTDKIGLGGRSSINNIKLGGDGNLSGPSPIGQAGVDKTGSGGGAGHAAGGRGGNGVVYITYFNYRILPVEFLYFNAIYQNSNRSGELKWATAKEWETSHFEIERSLNDTRNWTKVGEVTGKGYSDVPVEYSFTDLTLPASGGNIFYRLKQVDLKGDFQNSLTRAIQVEGLEGSTSWIAYPNPSAMRSSITVDLLDRSGYADESILIRISDARGIFESYSVSSPDEVSSVVNSYLEEARPGLHILQLIWGTKSEQLKLIRN